MSYANKSLLLNNTIFLYIRLIITLGVSLYTSRVVINALGIEDYGIHNVVAGAVAMVAFMNGAMAGTTQRFISFEYGKGASNEELVRVFSTSFYLHIAIAGIIFVIGMPFGIWMIHHVLTIPQGRIDAAECVVICAVLSLMSHVILAPYTALILSRERMKVYAYMSILDASIKLIIAFMLSFGGFDRLKLYAILLLIGIVVNNLIYITYCRLSFKECRLSRAIKWSKTREMGTFVGWNLSSHVAAMLANQGVNVLLNIFFGPAVNAARGIAMQASGTMQGFVSNLQVASAPQIVKSYSACELEALRELIIFTSKITLFFFMILGVPIFVESGHVLKLWLGKPPPQAGIFLQLVMIKAMIDCSTTPLYQAILATGKIGKYNLFVFVSLLGGFLVSWYLLASGSQAMVVFYVAIIVSLILIVIRMSFLRSIISFSMHDYAKQLVIPAVIVVATGSLIPIVIHFNLEEGLPRLLSVFASSFLCLPLAVITFGLTSKERSQLMHKLIQRVGPHLSKA